MIDERWIRAARALGTTVTATGGSGGTKAKGWCKNEGTIYTLLRSVAKASFFLKAIVIPCKTSTANTMMYVASNCACGPTFS